MESATMAAPVKMVSRMLTVVLAIALTGCATPRDVDEGSNGDSGWDDVNVDEYLDVVAQLDYETGRVVLPLDEVSLQAPALASKAQHAIAVLTDDCMAKEGFPRVSPSVDWSWDGQELRTFGLWDISAASKYGFGLDPATAFPTVDVLPLGVEYNKALPACAESATSAIDDDLNFLQATNIDYQIYRNAYDQTIGSDVGKAAFSERTACMESQDVIVDPETKGPANAYFDQTKEAQTVIATIFASCSVDTGAVKTLFDLQARYQAAYIDQAEAQIAELKQKRQAVESTLDEIIAGAKS